MTFSYGFPASRQKLCNMEKNVHKKIEKFAKNYMYLKKNFFLRCPPPYIIHINKQNTRKIMKLLWKSGTFCVFFSFLHYPL